MPPKLYPSPFVFLPYFIPKFSNKQTEPVTINQTASMMHESRGTPIFFIVVAIAVMFFSSTTRGDTPEQLSREELVRLAGYGEEKLSSVLVMGTLVCEACPRPGSDLNPSSHVAGAKITVTCKTDGKRRRRVDWAHGTTDEFGDFMIDLPSHLHATPRLEEACTVRVLRLPRRSRCHSRRALRMSPRRIQLSSVGNSIRVYTAGTLKLNHE